MKTPELEATVSADIAAPVRRVFRALTSDEVTRWWVRPGIFDTREWIADVRPGGKWQTSGMARGNPYTLDGEFLEVDSPRRLVFTWHLDSVARITTVTCELKQALIGTRLSIYHGPFPSLEAMEPNRRGWETSLTALQRYLDDE
jgi:uncharacterized protein YndB with AHSA1/START domain